MENWEQVFVRTSVTGGEMRHNCISTTGGNQRRGHQFRGRTPLSWAAPLRGGGSVRQLHKQSDWNASRWFYWPGKRLLGPLHWWWQSRRLQTESQPAARWFRPPLVILIWPHVGIQREGLMLNTASRHRGATTAIWVHYSMIFLLFFYDILDAVWDRELQRCVWFYIWSQWASDPCQEVQNADVLQASSCSTSFISIIH